MIDNVEFLKRRLAEYESKRDQASNDANYTEFQKWDFEIRNVESLIEMNLSQSKDR